jgi:hypothetical protein
MAQLTALSKQVAAIQQQQTSGNLARSGVSDISVGIRKPHTPAEKGAASDKSVEEFLTKYGGCTFSESWAVAQVEHSSAVLECLRSCLEALCYRRYRDSTSR